MRDIDPSLLLRQTEKISWAKTPTTWWSPLNPHLKPAPVSALLAWLHSDDEGFINGPEQIEVEDPREQRKWFVLDCFSRWGISREANRHHPEAWTRITCLLAKAGTTQKLSAELLADERGNASSLCEDRNCDDFLGEHGWRSPVPPKPRLHSNRFAGISIAYACTTTTLTAESGTKDNSVLDGFTLKLPHGWLLSAMQLRLRDGRHPEYVDRDGVVRFFDPSVRTRGPSAALVDRHLFLETLSQAGFEPIWVVAGEKNVYGADRLHNGFGGRAAHTTVYRCVEGRLFVDGPAIKRYVPTSSQLKALREAAFTVAGVVYMQLELWDRAKQMLERHLNLHPGAPEQTHLLAMSHYQMGHGREALKLWDDLLERFPAAQEALLYRGLQRAQLGLPEEARRDLELLMRVSPADSPLLKGAKEMLHRIDFEFAITRASGRAAVAEAGPGAQENDFPAAPNEATTLPLNAYKAPSKSH